MMKKKCEFCKKTFYKLNDYNDWTKRRFCSRKCKGKSYRRKNLKKCKEMDKNWREKNKHFQSFKIKRNKGSLKYYKKNKKKWQSRNETRVVLKLKSKPILINYECKKCGSKKNLQIHHEVYPTKHSDIRQAIKQKKIYFLCYKHHTKHHSNI